MKKVAIIISPNWKDYAKKYLDECLASLRMQDYEGEMKIFLIDNETSEESYQYLKSKGQDTEIIRNKNNAGFAEGCNKAMQPAIEQGYDCLFLVNMDTVTDKSCVKELVGKIEADESIGAVQARLMLYQEKNKINSMGNETHFLGFGFTKDYNLPISNIKAPISDNIFYPSGAAVMYRASLLKKIGLFDEEYWMYNEDQELGWRIWLSGHKCVLAFDAVVFHKYEFSKSIKQFYWMDRNRMITIVKYYHPVTLLLIFPACLVMEIGLLIFSIQSGWFKEKINVYKYFLIPKNWKYLANVRKKVQALRKVPDKVIVKMISGKIQFQEIDDWKLRFVNPVLNAYWEIVKFLIIW